MKRTITLGELLIVAFAVGVGVFITIQILKKDERMGPKALTELRMRRVEMYLTSFYRGSGVWPKSNTWALDLKPYFDADGMFSNDKLTTDMWGNTLLYSVAVDSSRTSSVILRSFGPNKRDDDGSADDIEIRITAN